MPDVFVPVNFTVARQLGDAGGGVGDVKVVDVVFVADLVVLPAMRNRSAIARFVCNSSASVSRLWCHRYLKVA